MTNTSKNILLVVVLLAGFGFIYVAGLHDPKQYVYMALASGGGLAVIYWWRRLVKKYPVSPEFLAVWILYLIVPLTFYGLATR